MGKFDDRVVVITGAGRGQGRSHALAFAAQGAKVVVCDIEGQPETAEYAVNSPGDLDETVRLVQEAGGNVRSMLADVRSAPDMQALADFAVSEFGRIDVFCANAGIVIAKPVQELDHNGWDDQIDVNLTGVFRGVRAVAPHMVRQESGRIIITSSALGRFGMANMTAYCAAKWGLIGLAKAAAIDLGPYNVTVNVVVPANTRTGILVNDMMKDLFLGGQPGTWEQIEEFIVSSGIHRLPVGLLEPEDISKAVLFLASDDARHITGSTLDVTAGASANYT